LEPLGITCLIHNPAVGENLQEHLVITVVFELDAENNKLKTLDALSDPVHAAEQMRLHAENRGLYCSGIHSFAWLPLSTVSPDRFPSLIHAAEAKVAKLAEEGHFITRPGLQEQYTIQLETLKNDSLPDCEIVYGPMCLDLAGITTPIKGSSYATVFCALNHPFSRGSIHIKSSVASDNATLDLHIFEQDIDLAVMVETVKYVRKLREVEPFKSMVVREATPGPDYQTDEDITNFVKDFTGAGSHLAGSCAMMPRDKGGVVDASLRVYGTKNLRVGDISILPLHIAAHTQSKQNVASLLHSCSSPHYAS